MARLRLEAISTLILYDRASRIMPRSPAMPLALLVCRRVGPYQGVVKGGAAGGASGLEVVLEDAEGCRQQLVLPVGSLGILRELLRQAARRLAEPVRLAELRRVGELRELGAASLGRLGSLIALAVPLPLTS
jgi:hypothetical protein